MVWSLLACLLCVSLGGGLGKQIWSFSHVSQIVFDSWYYRSAHAGEGLATLLSHCTAMQLTWHAHIIVDGRCHSVNTFLFLVDE